MSLEDDVTQNKMGNGAAPNPQGALLNALERTANAVADNPQFFLSKQHRANVDSVTAIVRDTFGDLIAIHENARQNRSNPFTGVKFVPTRWPVSHAEKQRKFWKPLEDLGYTKNEIKLTRTGYIIRVR